MMALETQLVQVVKELQTQKLRKSSSPNNKRRKSRSRRENSLSRRSNKGREKSWRNNAKRSSGRKQRPIPRQKTSSNSCKCSRRLRRMEVEHQETSAADQPMVLKMTWPTTTWSKNQHPCKRRQLEPWTHSRCHLIIQMISIKNK